jgi:hypothetical protein
VLADPQSLRNFRDRIAALRDLGHRIPLELIAEIYLAHLRLLTSNLGKKASRNLGAIQNAKLQRTASHAISFFEITKKSRSIFERHGWVVSNKTHLTYGGQNCLQTTLVNGWIIANTPSHQLGSIKHSFNPHSHAAGCLALRAPYGPENINQMLCCYI